MAVPDCIMNLLEQLHKQDYIDKVINNFHMDNEIFYPLNAQ